MNEQEKIRFNYTPLDDGSYEVKQGDLLRGYLEKRNGRWVFNMLYGLLYADAHTLRTFR